MSRVRVRLTTAGLRLAFDGGEGVFERQIEPLLLGLARGGPARRRARPAAVAQEQAPQGGGEPEAVEAVAVSTYAPPSSSFATFRRQLADAANGSNDRIPAYAFFLWNYEKKEVFGKDEVLGCFVAEDLEPPNEVESLCAGLCDRRVLEAAGDGRWKLTPKGRSVVRKTLS